MKFQRRYLFVLGMTLAAAGAWLGRSLAAQPTVGVSPWGPKDEIGRLNLMTAESRARVLARIRGGKAYDLAVEYFIGMPSWQAAGDPHYQLCRSIKTARPT